MQKENKNAVDFETFYQEVKTAAVDKFMLKKHIEATAFTMKDNVYSISDIPSIDGISPFEMIAGLDIEIKPDYIAIASEVWMQQIHGEKSEIEDKIKKYKRGDIAKAVDKTEALIIVAKNNIERKRLTVFFEIIREPTLTLKQISEIPVDIDKTKEMYF